MNMMNKCAKFHKDSPNGNKLNSISRERLNFRRRPSLCTTLYRNLMQASNFGGAFDQLFLCILFRPNQKHSLFPVARPGHFSPKSRISFLKMYACMYHVQAYICTHLSVPARRRESNFSRRGWLFTAWGVCELDAPLPGACWVCLLLYACVRKMTEVCCSCAGAEAMRDPKLLQKWKVVLPLCDTCCPL